MEQFKCHNKNYPPVQQCAYNAPRNAMSPTNAVYIVFDLIRIIIVIATCNFTIKNFFFPLIAASMHVRGDTLQYQMVLAEIRLKRQFESKTWSFVTIYHLEIVRSSLESLMITCSLPLLVSLKSYKTLV